MICKSVLDRKGRFLFMTDVGAKDESDLFQPLYQGLGGAGSGTAAEEEQHNEMLLEQVREKGFSEGLEIGRTEARAILSSSLRPGLNAFLKSCRNVADLEARIHRTAGSHITELALLIAEQILAASVPVNPEPWLTLIQSGMQKAERFSLNVHPEDFHMLRTLCEEAELEWPACLDLLIQGNEVMQPGEVRVEEPSGLRSQLEEAIHEGIREPQKDAQTVRTDE